MKIDWKRKLSSRKFWALIAALAVSVLTGLVSEATVAQVTGIITAVGACVAYMGAEAKIDAANTSLPLIEDETEDEDGTAS
jgi:FtsH-binding integral membrane protein